MGLGMWEIVIVLVVVLLFFGPTRLPGLGKSLGSAIRGFKKGISGSDEESKKISSQNDNNDEDRKV